MVRSVWKGPFVEASLLKKADAARASGRHDVIKIWSRRSIHHLDLLEEVRVDERTFLQ